MTAALATPTLLAEYLAAERALDLANQARALREELRCDATESAQIALRTRLPRDVLVAARWRSAVARSEALERRARRAACAAGPWRLPTDSTKENRK